MKVTTSTHCDKEGGQDRAGVTGAAAERAEQDPGAAGDVKRPHEATVERCNVERGEDAVAEEESAEPGAVSSTTLTSRKTPSH
jgi:hypothetical protein